MELMNVGELKKKFSDVIQRVQAGDKFVVCFGKKKEKVALLVPYRGYRNDAPRPLGLLKGKALCEIKKDFRMTDEEIVS